MDIQWVIPCLFVMTIAASMADLALSMPCVSCLVSYVSSNSDVRNERRTVLLLSETFTPEVFCARELDHRLGEYQWASGACYIYRLYMVCWFIFSPCRAVLRSRDSAQMITTAIAVGPDGRFHVQDTRVIVGRSRDLGVREIKPDAR